MGKVGPDMMSGLKKASSPDQTLLRLSPPRSVRYSVGTCDRKTTKTPTATAVCLPVPGHGVRPPARPPCNTTQAQSQASVVTLSSRLGGLTFCPAQDRLQAPEIVQEGLGVLQMVQGLLGPFWAFFWASAAAGTSAFLTLPAWSSVCSGGCFEGAVAMPLSVPFTACGSGLASACLRRGGGRSAPG